MVKIFRRGGVGPITSGDPAIDDAVTVEFCVHAKPAAVRFKDLNKGQVCMSPDRPDLPLDVLKILGYLAADMYKRQLLGDDEAEQIGTLDA